MNDLLQILLNLDESLRQLAAAYPVAIYALLALVLFVETAIFPASPFLPGDGLLFAVGVLSVTPLLNFWLVMPVMIVGTTLGSYVGYRLGTWLGPAIFHRFSWLSHADYLKAHAFYVKHGVLALFLSRYLPIVKALVPFVAGVAAMRHWRFVKYNFLSAVCWVCTLVPLGYLLGRIPFVEQHATLLIVGLAVGGTLLAGGLAAYRAVAAR